MAEVWGAHCAAETLECNQGMRCCWSVGRKALGPAGNQRLNRGSAPSRQKQRAAAGEPLYLLTSTSPPSLLRYVAFFCFLQRLSGLHLKKDEGGEQLSMGSRPTNGKIGFNFKTKKMEGKFDFKKSQSSA